MDALLLKFESDVSQSTVVRQSELIGSIPCKGAVHRHRNIRRIKINDISLSRPVRSVSKSLTITDARDKATEQALRFFGSQILGFS
jgi:hypothetical protein